MRLLDAPVLAYAVLHCFSTAAAGADSTHFVIQFTGGVDRHYMWGYPLGTVKEMPSAESEPRSGDL